MGFYIWGRPNWIRDGELNTLGWKSLNFSNAQILKKRCNFTLRWLLDLENTSLEQNLRLKTLDYLLFIPAIFYLLFDCSMDNFWLLLKKQSHSPEVTHLAFELSIFDPKVTQRDCVSTPNLVSRGLWSQWHNPLTHSPQTAENTLPIPAPSFYKIWKFP